MNTQLIRKVTTCIFLFFAAPSIASEDIVVSTYEPASSEWSTISFVVPVGEGEQFARISAAKAKNGQLEYLNVLLRDTTYSLSSEVLAQFSDVQLPTLNLFYSRESMSDPSWSMHIVFDFGEPDANLPFYDCNVLAGRAKRFSTAFVGIGVGSATSDSLVVHKYDGTAKRETALSIWSASSD